MNNLFHSQAEPGNETKKNLKFFRVYGLILRLNLDNMHFDKVPVFDLVVLN